ncbi:MAG TPA: hypothetical protein VJ891_17205 [Casimicrobiaceae bacterium]|nr:hypothetical protein [Casimicrobiaceae bacterium]
MRPSSEPTIVRISKQVIVFGGDERVYDLQGLYSDDIHVETYCSWDTEKVVASIRSGSITHVILLVRWMGHPSYKQITSVAKNVNVKLICWKHGLGKLAQELASLINEQTTESLPEEEAEALVGKGAADPGEDENAIAIQRRARDAGVTVACFQSRHEDCAYKGKQKIKCGCDCHSAEATPDAPAEVAEEVPAVVEPRPFIVNCDRILDVLQLDPSKRWHVSEIATILDAKDDEQIAAVESHVVSLIECGDLILCGLDRLALQNQKITLASNAVPQTPRIMKPASKESTYIVVSATGTVLVETDQQEVALQKMSESPGSRLFREIRTRLKVEIVEDES